MDEEKYVKICPKCGSLDISFDSLSLGQFDMRNGSFEEYCLDCNYGKYEYNAIFPQIKFDEIEIFRKKLKTK